MGEISQILVVEDDEADAVSIKRAARKSGLGVPVVIASNGEEALRALAHDSTAARTTIVLTDLNMPNLGGHELIDAIRNDDNLKRTIIFVMSSSREEADLVRAYDQHVAGYVVKEGGPEFVPRTIDMLKQYVDVVALPSVGAT